MATNDITGDRLISKVPTELYRSNYAKIFGPKDDDQGSERCPFCGILTDNPCDSVPANTCEQAINKFYGDPCK
jgi:hypothetical protein